MKLLSSLKSLSFSFQSIGARIVKSSLSSGFIMYIWSWKIFMVASDVSGVVLQPSPES